jgi:hypothetical protein
VRATHQKGDALFSNSNNLRAANCEHSFPSEDVGVKGEVVLRDIQTPMYKNVALKRTGKIFIESVHKYTIDAYHQLDIHFQEGAEMCCGKNHHPVSEAGFIRKEV